MKINKEKFFDGLLIVGWIVAISLAGAFVNEVNKYFDNADYGIYNKNE